MSSYAPAESPAKDARFWLVVLALSITALLATLEMSIVATALPTIVAAFPHTTQGFVWVSSGYILTMTAFQPLYGQLSDIYGRTVPLYTSIAMFVLSCGLCGGASSLAMLIAGRVIQGIGGAGINVLVETIVADIVPVRQRGSIMGIIIAISTAATAAGPVIGGAIVQYSSWRWIFYMNLPIAAAATAVLALVFRDKVGGNRNLGAADVDWIGNGVFLVSCAATILGLTWAGAVYPWASAAVLVPFLVGLAGLAGFVAIESTPSIARDPMVPLRLFGNRTSLVVFIISFLHGLITMANVYFLPVFLQAVVLSSPASSGVKTLPSAILPAVFAIVGGILLQKTSAYRVLHATSFALTAVGFGLYSTLDGSSSVGNYVGYQFVTGPGLGLAIAILLPVLQAKLDPKDTARSTATWSFLRSFGLIWGIAVPSTVLENRFSELARKDGKSPELMRIVHNGGALQYTSADAILLLPTAVRQEVVETFTLSLRAVWYTVLGFTALTFLLVFLEEKVSLDMNQKPDSGTGDPTGTAEESPLSMQGTVPASGDSKEEKGDFGGN